jgi:hypothetical protein
MDLREISKLLLVFWAVTPCGLVGRYQRLGENPSPSSAQKKEAVYSSESFMSTYSPKSTRRYNPDTEKLQV